MIQCPACRTLNPDGERRCLACGRDLPAAAGAATAGPAATCPQGHPIDPSWESCPYCARGAAGRTRIAGEASPFTAGGGARGSEPTRVEEDPAAAGSRRPAEAGRRTRLEGSGTLPEGHAGAAAAAPAVEPAWPGRGRPTRLEQTVAPPRRTVLQQPDLPPAAAPGQPLGPAPARSGALAAPARPASGAAGRPAAVETRPLVAVLAAPGLGPGGVIFPVRAGKTAIGGGPQSDVCLAQDPEVSGEHALLLHRGGRFFLADRLSTNGTFINGREVDGSGTAQLADRDRICCGATELILLVLEAGSERPARAGSGAGEAADHRHPSLDPSP